MSLDCKSYFHGTLQPYGSEIIISTCIIANDIRHRASQHFNAYTVTGLNYAQHIANFYTKLSRAAFNAAILPALRYSSILLFFNSPMRI